MMANCAFDTTSNTHEGAVKAANVNITVNGKAIAVVGDTVLCTDPEHTAQIASGSSSVFANGSNVAVLDSLCTCSATLTEPVSPNVFVGGELTQILPIDENLAEDDD